MDSPTGETYWPAVTKLSHVDHFILRGFPILKPLSCCNLTGVMGILVHLNIGGGFLHFHPWAHSACVWRTITNHGIWTGTYINLSTNTSYPNPLISFKTQIGILLRCRLPMVSVSLRSKSLRVLWMVSKGPLCNSGHKNRGRIVFPCINYSIGLDFYTLPWVFKV